MDRKDGKIPGVLREVYGGLVDRENLDVWEWFVGNCGFLGSIFGYDDIKKRLLRMRRGGKVEVNSILGCLIGDMHETYHSTVKKTMAIFRDDLLFVGKDIERLTKQGFTVAGSGRQVFKKVISLAPSAGATPREAVSPLKSRRGGLVGNLNLSFQEGFRDGLNPFGRNRDLG